MSEMKKCLFQLKNVRKANLSVTVTDCDSPLVVRDTAKFGIDPIMLVLIRYQSWYRYYRDLD